MNEDQILLDGGRHQWPWFRQPLRSRNGWTRTYTASMFFNFQLGGVAATVNRRGGSRLCSLGESGISVYPGGSLLPGRSAATAWTARDAHASSRL